MTVYPITIVHIGNIKFNKVVAKQSDDFGVHVVCDVLLHIEVAE